jgi:hypothetical protein
MRNRLSTLNTTRASGDKAANDFVNSIATAARQLASDEDLCAQVRKWNERPAQSWLERLSSNDLVKIILGFVLTGVLGALLTNYYAEKQRLLEDQRQQARLAVDRAYQTGEKERDRARSFADKLNETRVAKIAEVWEKLCLHEAAAARAIDSWNESTLKSSVKMSEHLNSQRMTDILFEDRELKDLAAQAARDFNEMNVLALEVRDLSDKNRFWIGESAYDKIRSYLSETNNVFKSSGLGSGSQVETRRRQARATLVEIRDMVLKE